MSSGKRRPFCLGLYVWRCDTLIYVQNKHCYQRHLLNISPQTHVVYAKCVNKIMRYFCKVINVSYRINWRTRPDIHAKVMPAKFQSDGKFLKIDLAPLRDHLLVKNVLNFQTKPRKSRNQYIAPEVRAIPLLDFASQPHTWGLPIDMASDPNPYEEWMMNLWVEWWPDSLCLLMEAFMDNCVVIDLKWPVLLQRWSLNFKGNHHATPQHWYHAVNSHKCQQPLTYQ